MAGGFPPGQGRKPWYLLTNEPIADAADAWKVVFAYARRWQVELCYRACKTDLAMESPRLWFWENRLTLLLMVSLRCSFLLSLLHPHCQPPVEGLLRNWCHRTGKRYRDAAIPLPRIRSALSASPTLPLSHHAPKIRDDSCLRWGLGLNGRGGRIRTGDPLHPMQVRYRAALRPDTSDSIP